MQFFLKTHWLAFCRRFSLLWNTVQYGSQGTPLFLSILVTGFFLSNKYVTGFFYGKVNNTYFQNQIYLASFKCSQPNLPLQKESSYFSVSFCFLKTHFYLSYQNSKMINHTINHPHHTKDIFPSAHLISSKVGSWQLWYQFKH